MIHYSRVLQGIASYVDTELVGKLAGSWQAWLLGGMAGIAISQGEQLFNKLKDHPAIKALGLIDGENINVEAIHAELRRQAQKGTATVALPIIGPVTFGPADVEALFHHIKGV